MKIKDRIEELKNALASDETAKYVMDEATTSHIIDAAIFHPLLSKVSGNACNKQPARCRNN